MKTPFIICIFALSIGALWRNNTTARSINAIVVDSISIDPICKMKVKQATFKSSLPKQQYLFCSKSCKVKFDKNPEKYVKK